MQQPSAQYRSPIAGGERFELIDALRGSALAGVLLVNLDSFSLYAFLDEAARTVLPTAGFDRIADTIKSLLVEEKAITVFSLLFGLGFALQLERAGPEGAAGLRLYWRRIGVLFLFGLVHAYLLWWGDILLVYAVMGALLVICRRLPLHALLVGGLFVALVVPTLLSPWLQELTKSMASQEAMERANLAAFSSPDWSVVLIQNVTFSNWAYAVWWPLWPFVFGRFLLGYWAGRMGLLQQPGKHQAMLRRIFIAAAFAGTAGTVLEYFQKPLAAVVSATAGSPFVQILVGMGPLALGIAYATGFALLFIHPPAQRCLRVLAPVGRMALTNYLMQTVVCLALFYGPGFDVGPEYGLAGILSAWVLLFGAQLLFSRWWLSRYRFGPMEWLWRSLTYGSWQPMSALRTV